MRETDKGFKLRDPSDYYDLEGIENYNTQHTDDLMMDGTNTTDNQLANRNFVNSSIQHMAANPRGNWPNWTSVPSDPTLYPADADGNKKPSNNDYMVVQDMTGYVNPDEPSRTYEGTWRFTYVGEWDNEYKKTEDISIDITKTYYTRSESEPYVYTEVENPVVEDIDTYYELIAGKGKNGWKPIYQVNEKPLTQEQVEALNSGINSTKRTNYDTHIENTNNPHQVTATQLGLGNVNNTSDADKPISDATQDALDEKVDIDQGVAYKDKLLGIGADGKVTPVDPPQTGVTPEQLATKLDKTKDIHKIEVVSELPKARDLYTMYLVVEDEEEWPGLKFTANQDNSTVGYTKWITKGELNIDIYYSTDGKTWTAWDGSNITLNNGQSIYVWNKNDTLSNGLLRYLQFTMSGSIAASGNVNSMINFSELTSGCYFHMFGNCSILTTPPDLPSTVLADQCYSEMFSGCTDLTTAPDLPAITLAEYCYFAMFVNCPSLETAPDLPAINLAEGCYGNMFSGCTALTTAPDLPATNLSEGCYSYMFDGCSSLNSIKLLYTGIFSSNYFSDWVIDVSSSGTLYYNGSDTTRGASAIPQNWAVQTF